MTTHTPTSHQVPPGGSFARQVTIAEAAELLSYGKRTVYRMVQTGELPSVGEGKLRRIRIADILAWQNRNRNGGE
ncbi:helix-turn-helix domain-containing protein [Oscillochloris sp. ZM17-4]|uniref:helix-turn-helix domain-containing protein n=1 Tax=Oscillochloris sp. ZM17-4 TaxID=2866714 RepID=UPI001C73507D|nr:helix-turn-helix domain-containing protein [Oscillochloris sp. ZM17-4]MBX0331327.1 helix-turn-helix domain-containing protein [Oscillochloris sp. ZM17-4]